MNFRSYHECFYNVEILNKFYSTLNLTNFRSLTKERMQEIDELVAKWKQTVNKNLCKITTSLMTLVASRMITSAKTMGLLNDEEIAYFYIKAVDENLMFLELSELIEDKDELKKFCKIRYGIYDNVIIYLEKKLNIRLQILELESKETLD